MIFMKIVNFVGYSGSGKTTLIEKIIPILVSKGLKVSCVKNAHHGFDMDKKGKDSYRYREAGATQIIVRSDDRWAMLTETEKKKPELSELISHLDPCDIVVVEGFKSEDSDALRLEIWRDLGRYEKPICADDHRISAVVTDTQNPAFGSLPIFDINNPQKLAEFILGNLNIKVGAL